VRYRVERVHIPSCEGIAAPDSSALDLKGRRVIHVITWLLHPDGGKVFEVVTEENDPPAELELG
jgi:hypothetical protein